MWPAAMLVRASLLLCLVVGSRQISITKLTVPSSVKSGESAELKCQYELEGAAENELIVKWWWKPLNESASNYADDTLPIQIYQRINGAGIPSPVHHSAIAHNPNIEIKENDTIVLVNASPADSGMYGCDVSAGDPEKREYKELIVFTPGSGPQINVSVVADGPDEDKEEDVLILCQVDDVAPAPDLQLKVNGKDTNMTEVTTGPDAAGLYDVVGNATLSKSDGYEITCELFYYKTNVSHERFMATYTYVSDEASTAVPIPPEIATETTATTDSEPISSGDICTCRLSWALLFVVGLFIQVPIL